MKPTLLSLAVLLFAQWVVFMPTEVSAADETLPVFLCVGGSNMSGGRSKVEELPKELKDAIKAGYKEVQNELKKKEREEKAKDKTEEPADEPEVKKADWRGVIARYGITEKDLEAKGADTELKIVRLGELELSTETDLFVFFDNQGKWVASSKASGLVAGNEGPTEVLFGTGKSDKTEHAKVTFKAHPPVLKDQKKAVDFTLDLLLEQAPPAAGETWRLPAAPATGGK